MNRPLSTVYSPLLAITSGLLLSASFAPLEWAGAAWVALIPLLVLCRHLPPRNAFKWGWVAGMVFWLTSIFWLTHVTVLGWFLLSAYCALYLGLFSQLMSWWIARFGSLKFWSNLAGMGMAAASWTGLEFLRSTLLSGFPWNPLGSSQWHNIALIQISSIGGTYALSGIIIWVSAAFGLTILRYIELRGRWGYRPHAELFCGLLVLVLSFVYGANQLKHSLPPGERLRVALVQPNIPQDDKWDQAKVDLIYGRLRTLTENALYSKPDLIVWPETALPDDLRSSENSYKLVYELATNGSPILVGTMDTALTESGPQYFNSSLLVNESGVIVQTYDKRHLVPFGEYVPFRRALPFMKAMTPIEESFMGGTTSTVFHLREAAFSALICFEDTVARLARDSVNNGARMLVNQTNDAWFDPSSASRQHLAQCVMRCVENRVPAVRSANSGATAHIDARGHVLEKLVDDQGGTLFNGFKTTEVILAPRDMPLTFYTKHGDVWAWACAVVTLIGIAWARRFDFRAPAAEDARA